MGLLSYIDPGTGSILIQAIAGGVAAAAVVAKLYWRRVRRRFGRSEEPEVDEP
jgi:hypothetical protein